VILRTRGATTRHGLVVFPAMGRFKQQLKLSGAFSRVPGQTCPGTAMVPFSWLQVIVPSSGTVTWGVGTGVRTFVTGWVAGTVVAGAGGTGKKLSSADNAGFAACTGMQGMMTSRARQRSSRYLVHIRG
jgi:hypothetical protein